VTVDAAGLQDAQGSVNQAVWKKSWGATIGYGSFLTLEFGRLVRPLDKTPAPVGEWHLWLHGCMWRLELGGDVLGGSGDRREHLEAATVHLNGRVLESVVLVPPTGDAEWRFAGGLVLRTFSIYSDPEGLVSWYLFTPNGRVLVVGPGAALAWQPSKPRIALDG
jgi:hypothetical protein